MQKQRITRKLMSALGGFKAMRRLQMRSGISKKHEDSMHQAEERVQVMKLQIPDHVHISSKLSTSRMTVFCWVMSGLV